MLFRSIRFFLSRRACCLKFQCSPGDFRPVSVSTPQGSRISPLLFVLYVAPLHRGAGRQNTFSFVHDFALISMSLSHRRNVQILQTRFRALESRARRHGLSFSIPKTELIHWRTPKDHSPRSLTPIYLDSGVFLPKEKVRWLGYWFTPNLASTSHYNHRLALARNAFTIIKKLSPAGLKINTLQTRRLVYLLLLPVISYGPDLFIPSGAMA